MPLTRRLFAAGSIGTALTLAARPVRAEAVLTDDGLYRQSWFLDSLLELADDLQGARDKGKRFAVMWELKGCPYCKQTHLVNFAKPEIESYIKERFEILQLNIIGLREVTDFDGERLSEKALAAKYGVRYTPTTQFFSESEQTLKGKAPREREVARAVGYQKPQDFVDTFRFVADRAYERGTLNDFLRARS